MVPKNWTMFRLSKLAKIKSGSTPLRSKADLYFTNNGIPWVKTMDLNNGVISNTDEMITELALKETSCSVFPVGTVLVAMYGGFNQIGRTGLLAKPAAMNQALSGLILNKEVAHPLFIQHYLNGNVHVWKKFAASSRKDPNITREDVCGFPILLPPLPEQKKIAQILSTWDKAISTTEQLLANNQQQKKALMQQLLTGKKRLLDKNGVRFSGEWKKIKVRDLIIQYSEKTDRNNQYPVLTSSRQGMFFQKDYYNGRDVASEDTTGYNVVPFGYFTYRHMSDDLIFSFNINDLCEKGIVSTLYPVFKAKEEKITPYLLRLILNEGREFKHFSLEQKQGGSRTYMYLSKLQELKLNIPSLEEQQKIAAVLSTAAQEISALQQKLAALKKEKKALMQQLLTGKRRVKVEVAA